MKIGDFVAGESVPYDANFHSDQGTIEDPTAPEVQLRTPAGVWSDLTAPTKQNGKTGHYGGTIDTTGFVDGVYLIRLQGTVSTAKVTAKEFSFQIKTEPVSISAQGVRDAMLLAPTAPGTPAADSVDDKIGKRALEEGGLLETAAGTISDNLDEKVSSRMATFTYEAPDNAGIAAIEAKTDQLTFTVPNTVDATASLSPAQIADIAESVSEAVEPIIWAAPDRSLTQSAAQVAAILAGLDIVALRGDKLVVNLTGVGALTGRTKLWFTAKRSKDDSDAHSIIQIEETDGLLYLNGEEAEDEEQGAIDVTVESTGSLTITVLGLATAQLAEETLFYDIQILDAESNPITRASGTLQVVADVTRNAGEEPEVIP
jgi:hypothetical protein